MVLNAHCIKYARRGFHRPVFSRIRTESMILPLHGRKRVSENRIFAYFMQWLVISPQHCYGWGDTRYWTNDTRSLSLSIVRQDSSLFPLRLLENKPNWATKEYVHYFFQAKDFIIDITHGQINTILFLLFFICFQCLVSFSFSNFWFVLSLTSAFYLQTFHCNDILTSYLIEKYHRTHWIWISSKLNLINFRGTRSWYFGQLFSRELAKNK